MLTKIQYEIQDPESNTTGECKSEPSPKKAIVKSGERSRDDLARLLVQIRRGEAGYRHVRKFFNQNNVKLEISGIKQRRVGKQK